MLIIFDLDGTLTPQRSSSTAPFMRELLPGVRAKCAELVEAGYILTIATNQGGLRKGLTRKAVEDILGWVSSELDIIDSRFTDGTNPYRKKPEPGMLFELIDGLCFSLNITVFVGDAKTDQQAAEAAGIKFIWAKDFF